MKKSLLTFVTVLLLTASNFAQVAINETGASPDASAILDLSSTTKGFLVPRVTTTERNAIGTTQSGLLVYDTDTESFWYYDNTQATWVEISNSNALNINGLSDGKTDDHSVFLGTDAGRDDNGDNSNVAIGIQASRDNETGERNVAIGNAALRKNENGSDLVAVGDSALYNNYYPFTSAPYSRRNTAIGSSSLFSNYRGSNNTATGYRSLYKNWDADYNTAFGSLTLFTNYSGEYNSAFGAKSLYYNDDGDNNIAVGYSSLFYNESGDNNIAIGKMALYANSGGSNNTATGYEALYSNRVSYNTANGYYALHSDTTGGYNTAMGTSSLQNNGDGSYNTASGYRSLYANTTGNSNTANGARALQENTTGEYNTAIGYSALNNDTTGEYNTAIGTSSLYANRSGNYNSATGYRSLYSNKTGYANVAIGAKSLYQNTDRSNLVAIGDSALMNNGTGASGNYEGRKNTAVGSKSSYSNTRGYENSSLGYQSLYSNTTGMRNTAMGATSLEANTTGGGNTAIGTWALTNNTSASSNVAVGYYTLTYNETGSQNTIIGTEAGKYNTSSYNTSLGSYSLEYNSSGGQNTAIGTHAGQGSYGNSYSGCVFLGYEAGSNNTSNNKLFIDNSSTSSPLIGGDFSTDQVDINGTIKITGGTPGSGKVLTSDADGDATWETPTTYASAINDLSDAITDGSSLFMGDQVGTNDDGTNYNTAVGDESFKTNTSGQNNIAFGYKALELSNGEDNSAVGSFALYKNSSGNNNTAVGQESLYWNSTGGNNTAVGLESLFWNYSGSNNTAVGYQAGEGSSGYSISGCVFLGYTAGYNNTSDNKLFIDNSATSSPLIGGDFSTNQVDINGTIKITGGTPGNGKVLTSDADGDATWETPTTYASEINDLSDAINDGSSLFIGDLVGTNDEGNNHNTAVGYGSFKTNTTGEHNIAFGYNALDASNGSGNSAVGHFTMNSNTSGNYNTALGKSSLYYNETGSNNTAVGYEAGQGYSGANNISGCVFLGYQAGKNNGSNNKLFIDNSSTSSPLIGGDFSSDELYLNADVGIGTNSPNELLEVAGASGANGRMIVSDGGGSDRYALLFVSPKATSDFARIEAYKYGTSSGGKTLKINTTGDGDVIFGGDVLPESHKIEDLGATGNAWDNVYADDYINEGAAAFANINVSKQLISFPPMEKKAGAFDEFTDKGLKELDPASLPKELTEDNALLIDEMTTYNYKANYEQQQQIETLKKENAELKARLDRLEKLLLEKTQ